MPEHPGARALASGARFPNLESMPDAFLERDFKAYERHRQDDPEYNALRLSVRRKLKAMADEMERRKREWTDVRYDDVEERMAGDDLIVQTFLVSGVDSRGRAFTTRAVDLYPLRGGKIAAKRTFWKQTGPGPAA